MPDIEVRCVDIVRELARNLVVGSVPTGLRGLETNANYRRATG